MNLINKFIKIIYYNIIISISIICLIFIFFSIINYVLSGQPRYWEIVHNKNLENLQIEKEKIVQIKKNSSEKLSYLSVDSDAYKKLNYSGKIKKVKCGSIENGYYDLIFQTDKFGYRENIDKRYINSDYVLLGDSFTMSICENKPNDLKSILLRESNYSYLNLGRAGTDYPEQFLIFSKLTENTKFNGVIWFFYEGNDYEQKSPENYSSVVDINDYDDEVNYTLNIKHKVSIFFRFKVWFAEFIRGPSVILKYFIGYEDLLDNNEYTKVHKKMKKYLDEKNINERYIVYIPSWQKLSLHRLKRLNLYETHPQVKQLNKLKENVKEISTINGFQFIDGDEYFFNSRNPLNIFNYNLNTHFNIFGNKILSKIITDTLK